MKPHISKKLQLNKQTVSRLNSAQMIVVKGGKAVLDPTFTATLGAPVTCFCSINTEPWSCCGPCDTPNC